MGFPPISNISTQQSGGLTSFYPPLFIIKGEKMTEWCENGCGKSVYSTSDQVKNCNYWYLWECSRCKEEYVNLNKGKNRKPKLVKLSKVIFENNIVINRNELLEEIA